MRPDSGITPARDAQSLSLHEDVSALRDPLLGRPFAQFRILKNLGQGGFSAVYQAENLSLGRLAALKILPPALAAANPQYAQRFLREAQSQAAVEHPNVVPIYSAGRHESYYYIEMQYVAGGSAGELLAKGLLPIEQAVGIIREAAQGLAAAHQKKLVHRDIKPENILLTEHGTAKVADFGLARTVEVGKALTTSGEVLGTPYYMSPEQCRARPLDERSDIYSLGVTFYHLLTGEKPFTGDSALSVMYHHCHSRPRDPRAIRPEIPEPLALVCLNAILKDPQSRYQTMEELIRDLDHAVAGHPVPIRATEPPREPEEWVSKARASGELAAVAPPETPGESARLADVIDQAAEEARHLRTRRVEHRIEEVRTFLLVWERFGWLLDASRMGTGAGDFERVRDALARGYRQILPRLENPRTLGCQVVATAKAGVTAEQVRSLSDQDFDRLQRHWEGGRKLLMEYVAFLEQGRQWLLRQSPLRYYWSKFLQNRMAAGLTLAAGALLASVIGVNVANRLPRPAERTKITRPTKTPEAE
ncbi:MAG: serine/threonine protein kinase, partial [Planctomycetes bacterium]|nr:serine/threonine protein kinase [Planctomycetota bacterium]